jgi:hypothetical protein
MKKHKLAIAIQLIFQSAALQHRNQVRAATHRNMLAIVHGLASRWIRERSGTPPDVFFGFQQRHLKSIWKGGHDGLRR